MELTTDMIPKNTSLVCIDSENNLDLRAICCFMAMGFFLESDTYWKNKKVLKPASHHKIDNKGDLIESKPYFQWHYSPRQITFKQALQEFSELFETIVREQTEGKKVILPLSGGLDSRTQAVALQPRNKEVEAYSYEFSGGYPETKIAQQLAKAAGFKFSAFKIQSGYLWEVLDELADLNQCYSDFTSPRQMAVKEKFCNMGEIFSLGHWGDVLFDDMKVPDSLPFEQQVEVVVKKLIKPGGMRWAIKLWEFWKLEGDFETYFRERITALLREINIPQNANAQIRAFKSLYWAPRWTSVNLSIFESVHPIALPYYDNRMCEFICTVPEEYLKNRQLQIDYIKNRAPDLAKVTWQDQRPFNLMNYRHNKFPFNLPYRIKSKTIRTWRDLRGSPYVMRNWELQFLGEKNRRHLEIQMYNKEFINWLPKAMIEGAVTDFYNNPKPETAHPLNMLLVLSKFIQQNNEKTN